MKKLTALFMAIVLSVCTCACSSYNNSTKSKKEDIYTVVRKDGTTEEMTYSEISNLYNNELKLEQYIGSEISGTGKIYSIEKTDNFNATVEIGMNGIQVNNVPIEVAQTLNTGDNFEVKGKLVTVFGSIVYINGRGYYD